MKIVTVKPVPSFCSNGPKVVEGLNVQSVADNLESHVIFKYTLFDADGNWAGEGQFELKGEDYAAWDSTSAMAYEIVAAGIGLEFEQGVSSEFFEA